MNNSLIRKIYLYGFSMLGLVLVVIGLVKLLDLGMKMYVFRQADNYAYPLTPPEKINAPGATMTAQEKEAFAKEQLDGQRKNQESQRQSTASNSLAMIIVGAPLFLYHWRKINN